LLLAELNKNMEREKIEKVLKPLLGDMNKMSATKTTTEMNYSKKNEVLEKTRSLIFDSLQQMYTGSNDK
jgi:hypothetical protein